MAINKKNFRKITVEDIQYFWTVTPDQWMLRLFITRGDNAYSNLKALFPQGEAGRGMSGIEITPGHVRAVIEQARQQGWHPEQKGQDMVIQIQGSIAP